ncbi:MAG: R3H domain-containing nucleic acid-binding protein [Candidatus Bipolaricaulota bacterium]
MDPQALEATREFFTGLLRVLGETGQAETAEEGEGVYANLRGGFRHLPSGDVSFRAALGRLARLHLKSHHGQDVPVLVDINGEVVAHREELATRVRDLARQAAAEHRRIELDPMPPDDRRVVHMTLTDFPGIRTYSVGRENNRHVVIEPVEGSGEQTV